ncbi:hypothetical protein [Anaeromyxobacter sp. Fw109-5]|uniref:hypothetical protein n=1 Tax=Anaeromyxobacter sp. (strain Fw109-5) TaxID=404589 RepID=UPI0000ED8AE6|nr:hypothetical protein [Anaeromyxobacter sp. Fw109-5]ABS27398.1 hypothetical protein Anae109_3202 [Anaeromyxobacter sp. Fw109-5]
MTLEPHKPSSWTVFALAVSVAACGGSDFLQGPPRRPHVELQGAPVAIFQPTTGKTTVALDFLVRDPGGKPVDPATAQIRRLVNGQEVDIESVPDFRDTKLSANLRVGMVLDASYSMTQWQPPAFEPMKQAALDTQVSIRNQFTAWNTGTFSALLDWFQDEYVCDGSPALPDAAVLDIPTPIPGDATKLFAATARMVDRMKQQYDAIVAPGPSDQFAMVVFTDGWDNYSWFDNSAAAAFSLSAAGGTFSCAGTAPMTLDGLLEKLRAFPQLQVHVIGLGNTIKASELSAIAETGHGRFVSNPNSDQVAYLFQEIAREFTTARRDGVTMPLPPGEYQYEHQVELNGGVARVKFRFRAGDANAGVVAGTVVTE